MEIHKPKPWHGWREFLKEYLIIVVGVLTALASEQLVERIHRSEEARVAERAMRLELGQDDGQQAFGRVVLAHCFDNRIAQIHDGAFAAPADQLRKWVAAYVPPYRSWDNEAWKAIVSSDIGNIMGAERLVDWSAAYRIVPGLNETNARESELAAQLRDALPPSGEPSAARRQDLRRLAGLLRLANDRMSRGSELFLARIRPLDATVPVASQQTLLSRARALYGDCVVAPDLRTPPAAGDPSANLRGFVHQPDPRPGARR
ncbi:hypothetical protein [Phenylobacterium sp.]|uniref:hypothetical protein n=1 Tax=Phenylobacterium sp. TaxID=1871053 RepID=UPI002DEFCFF9|nr:hypothetical protein [Phenylobacterium sp.]